MQNRSKPPSFVAGFEAFVRRIEGFESIDTLLKDVQEGQRANYLFRRKTIICEQKEMNIEAQAAWEAYVACGRRLGEKYGIDPQPAPCPGRP